VILLVIQRQPSRPNIWLPTSKATPAEKDESLIFVAFNFARTQLLFYRENIPVLNFKCQKQSNLIPYI
jgi:hypothetical protein